MEDLPPFWEEDCLSGSIDQNPFPVPPQSFFENDLFCNENIDSNPDLNPAATLESLTNDTFDNSVPMPQNFSHSIPTTPPHQPVPVPFPLSPTRLNPESPQRNSPWRSFFDDGCPLRRRVKVTITPLALGKRALPPVASPRASKKSRLSTDQTARQNQPQSPRLTQTKLRLPDSSEFPGRITLHVPYKSDLSTGNHSSKQPNRNANNVTEPSTPTNDPTHVDEMVDIQSALKETMGTDSTIELEAESDLDEPFPDPSPANEGDETTVLPMYEQEGNFLFEVVDDPCAQLSEIISNPSVGNLPHLGHCLNEVNPTRRHGIPATRRPARKVRECISVDLNKRIANIAMQVKTPAPNATHTDSVHTKPLVSAALQAISRATQKYKSFINKVGSVQPAAAIVESLMNSAQRSSIARSGAKEMKAGTPSSGRVGKAKAGRKKGRRKRSTSNQQDTDEQQHGKVAKGSKEATLSDELCPLARYLNTQSGILKSAG